MSILDPPNPYTSWEEKQRRREKRMIPTPPPPPDEELEPDYEIAPEPGPNRNPFRSLPRTNADEIGDRIIGTLGIALISALAVMIVVLLVVGIVQSFHNGYWWVSPAICLWLVGSYKVAGWLKQRGILP